MNSSFLAAMGGRTSVVCITIALFLAACGGDSQQARETLASWSKSLDLLQQQRTQQHVPETYVRQMVHAATKALNEQQKQLPDDPAVRELDARIRNLSSADAAQ